MMARVKCPDCGHKQYENIHSNSQNFQCRVCKGKKWHNATANTIPEYGAKGEEVCKHWDQIGYYCFPLSIDDAMDYRDCGGDPRAKCRVSENKRLADDKNK